MAIAAIAFDAFGTLFDLGALRQKLTPAAPGREDELFEGFSSRLLPFTWHATASGHYKPMPEIASLALASAARELDLPVEKAKEAAAALTELPPMPGAAEALDRLSARPLAVLTNGTREGAQALLSGAGWNDFFAHVLCADDVGKFKPAPEVYALATQAFGEPAERVLLVSGNEWDIAGASQAGLTTAWVAQGRPSTRFLGEAPDFIADNLRELPGELERWERRSG